MEVKFNGMVAETNKIKYSVKQNNNSNVIVFKIAKNQDQIILDPTKHFYVKVQSCMCKDFFDKDPRAVITEDTNNIYIAWTMKRKHTQFKNIDVQIQYEVASQDIVWQTNIINIDLFATIPADKEIENKYPSILTLMQEQLDDHEARITALEQAQVVLEWGQITGNIENQEDLVEFVDGKVNTEKDRAMTVEQALRELIENIQVKWGFITGNIEDQADLKQALDTLRAIAEGNTKSYSVDTDVEGNEIFKSDDVDIVVEEFTDINGNVIRTSDLKNGDLIFTKNTATKVYQDRWLLDKENNIWSILSADDPRLENYYTKAEIQALVYTKQQIDQMLENYYNADEVDALLEDKANDSEVVHLIGNETIGGEKTFSAYNIGLGNSDYVKVGNSLPSNSTRGIFFGANITGGLFEELGIGRQIDTTSYADAIGFRYTIAKANYSVALGGRSSSYVANWVSFDGESKAGGTPVNRTIALLDPTKIFFRYENVSSNKTTKNSYANGKTLQDLLNNIKIIEFDPTKYIILQGSKFIQVDQLPQDYTGLGYQFGETGLQVLYFRNGVDTGITASIENDTIVLSNGDGHTISMNSNTGKILIDSDQSVVSNNLAKVIRLTQQEYDNLSVKASDVMYIIVG